MQVSKNFKFSPADKFGSRGMNVSVSHEELGLPDPTTPAIFMENTKIMSYHLEAVMVIEEARYGVVAPDQIPQALKAWMSDPTAESLAQWLSQNP